MNRARLAAAALLWTSCIHARQVGEPEQKKEQAREEPALAGRRLPAKAGRPPIAPSPEALLAPGGAKQIQSALTRKGLLAQGHETGKLDERTSAALRKFQERQGLAATGAPDHETLRQLGLDPKRVFRTRPGADQAR